MTEQQLREEMVQIGASLFSRGYATGSAGNLSLLLPDGNLLATPTGACLGELQAQRLSVVTLQGEWISGDKPSKEVTFHRAVYLHNPACKAIVTHLHSHYLTALSCLQGLDPHNWACCKVSDEAAFCLIQRPYISKTLLTGRISPGDHHNKMLRPAFA
jgi:ribulose-5-phosphate 4-epimerase/fuculose-1-phosphate aldolase